MDIDPQASAEMLELTGYELELAEIKGGMPLGAAEDTDRSNIRLIFALAWVHERRNKKDPEDFETYFANTTMADVQTATGLDEDTEDTPEQEGKGGES